MNEAKIRLMLEAEKELTSRLTENERFMYYLGRMQFLKYESGKENLMRSDCSGSVCLALLLATGCSIRVTADALYRKYFTVRNPDRNSIRCAFFITNYDRKLGSRLYKENEVAHCAGLAGEDVVLNCVEPRSVLRSLSDLRPVYYGMDYRIEVRGLNKKTLLEANEDSRDLFGPDAEFLEYKRIVSENKVTDPSTSSGAL